MMRVFSNSRAQIKTLLSSIMQLRKSKCKFNVRNAAETVQLKD